LESAEELVVPGSRFIEIPNQWHSLYQLFRKFRFYEAIADGNVFLLTPEKIEYGLPLRIVSQQIKTVLGCISLSLLVERIDIRSRGAMVLFISEKCFNLRFVSRLVSDLKQRSIVRRNHTFLKYLRSNKILNNNIKDKIPIPVGEAQFTDISLFTETAIDGVVAWKASSNALRESIYNGASSFIFELQKNFKQKVFLNDELVGGLFREDIERLNSCPAINDDFLKKTCKYIKKIQHILCGREWFITVSHGDFGYGNILVNSNSGELAGVIDWDTGKQVDLPGIDYVNLMVQRNRSGQGIGLFRAFEMVFKDVLSRGSLDKEGFYASEFRMTDCLIKVILYVEILRYMTRAAQYPEVFASEENDFQRSLIKLESIAPL